jgi:actin, other eukaryote
VNQTQSKCQMDDDFGALCIDCGSSLWKAGFAGDDAPRAVFPTLVGGHKEGTSGGGLDLKDLYVGDEAWDKRGMLDVRRPIERGMVDMGCWEDVERLFHHTFFNALRVTHPEERPIMVAEPPYNPPEMREKLFQMCFETFEAPAFFAKNPAVLSMYASGWLTGIMVDCSAGTTHSVPIYEGEVVAHGVRRMELGGDDLTEFMAERLGHTVRVFLPCCLLYDVVLAALVLHIHSPRPISSAPLVSRT